MKRDKPLDPQWEQDIQHRGGPPGAAAPTCASLETSSVRNIIPFKEFKLILTKSTAAWSVKLGALELAMKMGTLKKQVSFLPH